MALARRADLAPSHAMRAFQDTLLAFLAEPSRELPGDVQVLGLGLGVYRLFLIGVVAVITVALHLLLVKTRFGAQVRASVDNAVASAGLGINVNRVFGVTFALGSGLAGLGGGLGIDVLGLDPTFPFKYMVYFLLVVVIGGVASRVPHQEEVDRLADPGLLPDVEVLRLAVRFAVQVRPRATQLAIFVPFVPRSLSAAFDQR